MKDSPPNHIAKIARLEAKAAELRNRSKGRGDDVALQKRLNAALANLADLRGLEITRISGQLQQTTRDIERQRERAAETVHDLKVPITVCLLNLELASMENDKREEADYLVSVRRELEFLLDTISNLLELDQHSSTQVQAPFQQVDLRELLDATIARMEVIITDKPNLKLMNEIGADVPTVTANRHQLIRVFNNLFSNAIKYTDEGSITVSATFNKKRKTVRLSVKDTGHGIEPERIPYLFDLYQGDAKRQDSTGVGLAFVKLAALAHKGKVALESSRGKGTTVYFEIPVGG